MDVIYQHDNNAVFVIDIRSMETKGPAVMSMLAPFLEKTEIKVVKSKHESVIDKIYMGNQPPFISVTKPMDSIEVGMNKADISILVDYNTSKLKDTYFTLTMANLLRNHKVYGQLGPNFGYIFTQYKLDPANIKKYLAEQNIDYRDLLVRDSSILIRIPNIQIETDYTDREIPLELKPYIF